MAGRPALHGHPPLPPRHRSDPRRRPNRLHRPLPTLCRMLRSRFRVVPLAEVFDTVRSGRDAPPRTVAVTFDDCYRDNLFAARVLTEHGLPAAFFVPTAFVGTDRIFPWDRGLPVMPNLTWDDMREMAAMGHEIGSHTVSHPNLGTAPVEEARQEIFESKAVLEQQLERRSALVRLPLRGEKQLPPGGGRAGRGGGLRRLPVGLRRLRSSRHGQSHPAARLVALLPGPAQRGAAPPRLPRLVVCTQTGSGTTSFTGTATRRAGNGRSSFSLNRNRAGFILLSMFPRSAVQKAGRTRRAPPAEADGRTPRLAPSEAAQDSRSPGRTTRT